MVDVLKISASVVDGGNTMTTMTTQSPILIKQLDYYSLFLTIDQSQPVEVVGGKFWTDISSANGDAYLVFGEVDAKNEEQYYKTTATDQLGRVYWTYWSVKYINTSWCPCWVQEIC